MAEQFLLPTTINLPLLSQKKRQWLYRFFILHSLSSLRFVITKEKEQMADTWFLLPTTINLLILFKEKKNRYRFLSYTINLPFAAIKKKKQWLYQVSSPLLHQPAIYSVKEKETVAGYQFLLPITINQAFVCHIEKENSGWIRFSSPTTINLPVV
ncbi:hypothetical protein AVEN_106548-1 [Araneus ventricosus]|uniref:Uncharacterized protein n=1 Tax=Araneus ventricosus TaxID=182803 RepID=A0A4Y2RJI8_ARAVE|nr:hypothetical protein AVEN_106548-1 [Araneus ventricosus]